MEKSADFSRLATEADAAVLKARSDMGIYGVPMRDYQAWRSQYHSAKMRGIPFHFTLVGWRQWWSFELGRLEPGAKRGKRRDEYVMARKRDRGAYEPGNVFATKPVGNMRDRDPLLKEAAIRKATVTRALNGHPRGQHLKVRGEGHPKSHPVVTPMGWFGSVALAAEAHGMTRQGGLARVRRGVWTLA